MRIQILVLCFLFSCECLSAQLMMEAVEASDTTTFLYHIEGEEPILLSVDVVGDKLIAGGDMVVGNITDLVTGRGGAIARDPNSRWPNGRIPYEIAPNHPLTSQIHAAYQNLSNRTNLLIIPRDSTDTRFVYIDSNSANGCRCNVGMKADTTFMNLAPRCSSQGTIQHEMLHAAGFFHEQMRRDRGEHIRIMWDNIKPDKFNNFKKYVYGEATALGNYDYESIMQYSGFTNNTNFAIDVNKPIITTRDPTKQNLLGSGTLSDNDIRQINRVYQANGRNSAFTSRGGNSPSNNSSSSALGRGSEIWNYTNGQSFNIQYEVELVPQQTGMSCWAAGAAMLVGWYDRVCIDPEEIARRIEYWAQYNSDGLTASDMTMLDYWFLEAEPPQSYTVDGFVQLLGSYGPLWVATNEGNPHIRVVAGASGDGTPDGTILTIYDPWQRGMRRFNPNNTGSVYQETFAEFERKNHELAETEMGVASPIYVAHN